MYDVPFVECMYFVFTRDSESLVEFMYLCMKFTRVPDVTEFESYSYIGDSGLCCCVQC